MGLIFQRCSFLGLFGNSSSVFLAGNVVGGSRALIRCNCCCCHPRFRCKSLKSIVSICNSTEI